MLFSISEKSLRRKGGIKKITNSQAGAMVVFEGWVRDENEGRSVVSLEYEAFRPLALKEGLKILEEAMNRYEVLDVSCIHRVGRLEVGELAVWVHVISRHRAEAFDACRYIIDEVKRRVPIWKKEYYKDGESNWVHCEACAGHTHHH